MKIYTKTGDEGETSLLSGKRVLKTDIRIESVGVVDELNAWFLLNHFVDSNDAESIRQWNLYLDTGGLNIPGGKLSDLVPNNEMLKKMLNYGEFEVKK